MKRVIISTVGTSLITNQLTPQERQEGYFKILTDSANLKTEQDLNEQQKKIINTLKDRAVQALAEQNIGKHRALSAELNGIYGIYYNNLEKANKDIHVLITTDTYQCSVTSGIIKNFLLPKVLVVDTFMPENLNTKDTVSFSMGIKELIKWCYKVLPKYKEDKYKIIFNLVGGFKSIQAYMNTIGMFYADEIVYIFESEKADLIKIPKLPISIDESVIKNYTVEFSLMEWGKIYNKHKVKGIPESLLDIYDESNVAISNWGMLFWNSAKNKLLTKELLEFFYVEYSNEFKRNFKDISTDGEKINLQETLAKVSFLLEQNKGDVVILSKDGGLQYENYKNKPDIAHFRINDDLRVSCSYKDKKLFLRKYGHHDEINRNP